MDFEKVALAATLNNHTVCATHKDMEGTANAAGLAIKRTNNSIWRVV